MKKWTRWEDWVAVAVGLVAAGSTFFMEQSGASMVWMRVLGVLLIASGLVNLAMPGLVATEYVQLGLGALLFIAPWIGGYAIPAGTTIIISPWVSHRDPRYFDNPTEFRPERWSGDLARRLPRFAYMPFGGGPRICIGNRFAMMEAVLILATVAQRFKLEWQSDRSVVPLPSITLRPQGGIWVRPVPRTRRSGSDRSVDGPTPEV